MVFLFLIQDAQSQYSGVDHIFLREEHIQVEGLHEGYITEVRVWGRTGEDPGQTVVYYSGFDSIRDISLFLENSRGKFKKEKSPKVAGGMIRTGHFNSDSYYKGVDIPAGQHFRLTYKKYSSELMLLAHLPFYNLSGTDTIRYILDIPGGLSVRFDILKTHLLGAFRMDSLPLDGAWRYILEGIHGLRIEQEKEEEKVQYFVTGVKNLPSARLIIVPDTLRGKETTYFIRWYNGLLEDRSALDSTSVKEIDRLTQGDRGCHRQGAVLQPFEREPPGKDHPGRVHFAFQIP